MVCRNFLNVLKQEYYSQVAWCFCSLTFSLVLLANTPEKMHHLNNLSPFLA